MRLAIEIGSKNNDFWDKEYTLLQESRETIPEEGRGHGDKKKSLLWDKYFEYISIILLGLILIGIVTLTLIAGRMASSVKSPTALTQLSDGNIALSKKLYGALKNNTGNIFYSPMSLEFALAILYAGAAGKTAQEIKTCLVLPDSKEGTYSVFSDCLGGLTGSKGVTLNIANGLFIHNKFNVNSSFVDIAKKYFSSQVTTVNFSKDEAVDIINNFVEKETNKKITNLFEKGSFNDLTRLVISNAIYFKGDWLFKFNPSSTFKGDFYLNENDKIEVDFMKQNQRFKVGYRDELNSTVVCLPYKGDKLSMVLIIPNEREGLKHVEKKLNEIDFPGLVKDTYEQEIILTMPKFKLTQTLNLKKILMELGMPEMFSDKADLSGISNESLFVSDVVQKAYIEVNEEGSEAAAATAGSCRRKRSAYKFVDVDRPFMFFVHYHDVMLFIGSVQNASAFDEKPSETWHDEL